MVLCVLLEANSSECSCRDFDALHCLPGVDANLRLCVALEQKWPRGEAPLCL